MALGRKRGKDQSGVPIRKLAVAECKPAGERRYNHGTSVDYIVLCRQAGSEVDRKGCKRACTEAEADSCHNYRDDFRLGGRGSPGGKALEHRRPCDVPAGTRAGKPGGRRLMSQVGTRLAEEAGRVDK